MQKGERLPSHEQLTRTLSCLQQCIYIPDTRKICILVRAAANHFERWCWCTNGITLSATNLILFRLWEKIFILDTFNQRRWSLAFPHWLGPGHTGSSGGGSRLRDSPVARPSLVTKSKKLAGVWWQNVWKLRKSMVRIFVSRHRGQMGRIG